MRDRVLALQRRLAALAVAMLAMLAAATVGAHALHHAISGDEAVTVTLFFTDRDRPLFEPYEIYGPGDDDIPFQAGRINAIGEISFRPDRAGQWRVQVDTADGHGARIRIEVDATGVRADGTRLQAGQPGRIVAGLGWLLGAFGLVALWRLWRRRRDDG